jgi:hypothetical protein
MVRTPPPANSNVNEIADRAKQAFAAASQLLAETQYRLGELTGLKVLEAAESVTLQHNLCAMWDHLYFGLLCAIREEGADDPRAAIGYTAQPRRFKNEEPPF